MVNKANFRPWVIAVAAMLILGWAVPVIAAPPAQTGTPIRYGETVSGEITEETPCQYYWFDGEAGDPISIDMTRTSGSLDGVLALYQRDGSNFSADPVATNDDRPGGGLDPLITFTLPAADWYTIAACRLQAEQMRVTVGTYSLTLTGPQTATAAVSPTPGSSLSNSIFGSTGATATPAPPPTAAGMLSDTPGGTPDTSAETTLLADGSIVSGELAAGAADVRYDLPVIAGDQVVIAWQRMSGDAAPLLRVADPDGAVLAEVSTPDAVSQLKLAFRAPSDGSLTFSMARAGGEVNSTTATYELHVSITSLGETPAEQTSPGQAAEADYLANPCQSGADAITGLGSTARLIDVYTASGDSYYADELTRTTVFSSDDDLNVVFLVQNVDASVAVAGVFCAPDGNYYDGDENVFDNGGPYLVGLDWESQAEAWVTGDWYVELYVDDQLEMALAFTVQ